jgi:hypothetical protein
MEALGATHNELTRQHLLTSPGRPVPASESPGCHRSDLGLTARMTSSNATSGVSGGESRSGISKEWQTGGPLARPAIEVPK